MAWLGRNKQYDRRRILAAAAKARKTRRYKKALELYQRVLEVEPENPDVLRHVAPLLARTKQPAEAWVTYQRAAQRLVEQGFVDQGIGVYREAASYLPTEVGVWQALAGLELERKRAADAVKTLLEGRQHFRSKRFRRQCIDLLIRAARGIARCGFSKSSCRARTGARGGASARACSGSLPHRAPRGAGCAPSWPAPRAHLMNPDRARGPNSARDQGAKSQP
jgi:tetratricopeptide (TPR) repeat protein